MKVISTNIGKSKSVSWKGKEVKTGIFKFQVDTPLFLGDEDVKDDDVIDRRYHGGIDKACYLYSANHYSFWQNMYPRLEMPWGMFGENLTIEGLHETEVNVGDIFKMGTAVVQATQPRQPCFKLEFRFKDKDIVQKFVEAGFPGVYIRVLETGTVKKGDAFELLEKKDSPSIQAIYKLLYASEFDPMIKQVINNNDIAASCKKDLLKRWADYL